MKYPGIKFKHLKAPNKPQGAKNSLSLKISKIKK